MHAIQQTSRSLRLLAILNADRVLYLLTVLGALLAGAWVGMIGVN